jgi:hypothetical protein
MLQLFGLEQYTPDMLALIAVGIAAAGLIIGLLTDAVLSDRGFGPLGNGLLAILGTGTGIYTRHAFFGWLQGQEIIIIGSFAGATATLMLLILGLAKHWVQD